jgi:hypothetical protein
MPERTLCVQLDARRSSAGACSRFHAWSAIQRKADDNFADRSPSLPAFFHHARISRLKSSAISVILIERTFKMMRRKPMFPVFGAELRVR